MDGFIGQSPKILVVIFVAVLFFHAWSTGYFRGWSLKALPWKFLLIRFILPAIPLVLAAVALDPVSMPILKNWEHPWADDLAHIGGQLGRNVHPWFFLALLYLISLALQYRALPGIVSGAVFSATLAGAFTLIFKFFFLRARPSGNLGHLSFFNPDGLFKDEGIFQSFSSGDVAVVAGICFYFFFVLKDRMVRWLLVLLPLSTAYARIYANKHWPSDTLLGMGLGLMAAYCIFKFRESKNARKCPETALVSEGALKGSEDSPDKPRPQG